MVQIASLTDPTLAALNAAIESEFDSEKPRPYLGMSGIGSACARAVWYDFRWATPRKISATGLRAIQDGYANEELTAARLRRVPGLQLWTTGEDGQQIGCTDHSGHFRGHLDGVILGLLQAPKTPHVWENKAVNEKKFNALKKQITEVGEKSALREWDMAYFAQAQLYMHYQGLKRHYLTVNTPGGRDTISCRTEYDAQAAQRWIEIAHQLIAREHPPERISNDPAYYRCKWCHHHALCHGEAYPKPTCRSCAHVTPMLDEVGGWHCRKWQDRIPVEAQYTGCESHLYHPEFLNHVRPVHANLEENWICYQYTQNSQILCNGPAEKGGLSSAALYAGGSPEPPTSAPSEPPADPDVETLSELSADSAIPTTTLLSGDLTEQDWAKVTQATRLFHERWHTQPLKMARLGRLLEFMDHAFLELLETTRFNPSGNQ